MATPNPLVNHPVVTLLQHLMSIPSTSNSENAISLLLQSHLESLGYTVELHPIAPKSPRQNIYAYLRNTPRHTRILVTAHMDTVPPHIPFRIAPSPTDPEDLIIHGRGSSDDLGPLAAQIIAVEELRREGKLSEKGGEFAFLFVVGEENGGAGMEAANSLGLEWEAGIFAEPTENRVAKGHKGQVAFEVVAKGVACHSGYPSHGSSATSLLLSVLTALSVSPWPSSPSPLLGPSTFNIGTLSGGTAHNILAPSAKALCEVRPVADLPGVKQQVLNVVSKFENVEVKWVFEYPEALLDWEEVLESEKASEGFEGSAKEFFGEAVPVAFGTDVPRLKGGHKQVLYGPGSILVAHGPQEYISVKELVKGVEGYKRLVRHFLS